MKTKINSSLKFKSGIYCIINKSNNKRYIGSSVNIWQRLQKHFSLLRKNKHENIILQNAFNKHGEEVFHSFCIEFTDNLLIQEQYYIDLFNTEYNITRKVLRNKLSEASKLKISNTLKEGYNSGRIKSFTKTIYAYTINGEFHSKHKSLKSCCKSLGIGIDMAERVLYNKYRQTKGFVLYFEIPEIPKIYALKELKRDYTLNLPNKKVVCLNTETNETMYFDSCKECGKYFKVHWNCLKYSVNKGILYKEKFKITMPQ